MTKEEMWKREEFGCHGDVRKLMEGLKMKLVVCGKDVDKMTLQQRMDSAAWIDSLLSLEGLFVDLVSTLTTTRASLSSAPQQSPLWPEKSLAHEQAAVNAQRRILECAQSWQLMQKLHICSTTHTQHCSNYHQFFTDVHFYKQWLVAEVTTATEALKQLPVHSHTHLNRDEFRHFVSLLMNLIETHKRWRHKLQDLSHRSSTLTPIHLRSQSLKRETYTATCITDYRSNEVFIQKGEEVRLIDKDDSSKWQVRQLDSSQVHTIPSIFLTIVGPCPEAEQAVLSLVKEYAEVWRRSVAIGGLYAVRLLNKVLKEKDVEDEAIWSGKWQTKVDEVIALLELIEETFGGEWWGDGHVCLRRLKDRLAQIKKVLYGVKKEKGEERCGKKYPSNINELEAPFNPLSTSTPFKNKDDHHGVFVAESELISKTIKSLKDFFFDFTPKLSDEFKLQCKKVNWADLDLEGHDECDPLSATNEKTAHSEVYELMTDKHVTETSQVTTSQLEERQTFVITGVIDPESMKEISFDEAVSKGVINKSTGRYVKGSGDDGMPIQSAMNEGLIKVKKVSTQKTQEKKSDIGLITIKSFTETRPYIIKWVVDAVSNKKLNLEQAVAQGVIDLEKEEYNNLKKKVSMSFSEALDSGFLTVEFSPRKKQRSDVSKGEGKDKRGVYSDDDGIDSEEGIVNGDDEDVVTKTYLVTEVLDTVSWQFLSFKKASHNKIICPDTGLYFDRATRTHLKLAEAIKKGFVKGQVISDPKSIDLTNL